MLPLVPPSGAGLHAGAPHAGAQHATPAPTTRDEGRREGVFDDVHLYVEVFFMMCTHIRECFNDVHHSMVHHLMVRHLMVRHFSKRHFYTLCSVNKTLLDTI